MTAALGDRASSGGEGKGLKGYGEFEGHVQQTIKKVGKEELRQAIVTRGYGNVVLVVSSLR